MEMFLATLLFVATVIILLDRHAYLWPEYELDFYGAMGNSIQELLVSDVDSEVLLSCQQSRKCII